MQIVQETEAGDRIPYLDGWRGMAVLFVILDHFSHGVFWWAGDLGVELFFVLSGSLMAQIIFVRKVRVKTFIVRRLSRVYPALFVFATTIMITAQVARHFGLPEKMSVSPSEYISSLTFLSNYYQAFTGSNSVLGHLWSLSVEEHTYLILLLIAAFCRWRIRAASIAMAAVAILSLLNGFRLHNLGLDSHAVYWRTDVRILSIILSCILFMAMRKNRVPGFASPFFLVAGILIFAFLADPVRFTVGSLCLAISINSLAGASTWFRMALSGRVLTKVGLYSYSIYLWQQPFYKVAERSPWWITPVALIATLIAAVVSFRLIEQPARNAINARFARLRASGA